MMVLSPRRQTVPLRRRASLGWTTAETIYVQLSTETEGSGKDRDLCRKLGKEPRKKQGDTGPRMKKGSP